MSCFGIFKSNSQSSSSTTTITTAAKLGKSTRSMSSSRSISEMYKEKEHNLIKFSLSELKYATNNFNMLLKIGEGGFGSVYKGTIKPPDGQGEPLIVAIKKLNSQSSQGHKEWRAEVQILGIVDHPNLVKLLGHCSVDGEKGTERLLVYEYVRNKSLHDHLFGGTSNALPWKRRVQIMLEAAEGLAYLHEGLEVQVIYRDFKSSNVLLDEDFKPKLSDFGFARQGPSGDRTHVSTMPCGTFGYTAPEYVVTGHLKDKTDIWSFGVVLYEVLTGRRVLDRNRPKSEQKLLEWVKHYPADSKRFRKIMDPRLNNSYSLIAARRIAKLADSCLNKNPEDRPTMSHAVTILKQALQESEDQRIQRSSFDLRHFSI